MNFTDYQKKALETAIYPNKGNNLLYLTLGLNGEAGEVADKIKKLLRDHGGTLSPLIHQELIKELGDVLWYLAVLAWELNVDLEEIARKNIDKVQGRKQRGVLHGEGDNR